MNEISDVFGFNTAEDILVFMNSGVSNEFFQETASKMNFWGKENNYLTSVDNDIYVGFVIWLIIVKYSNLHKNIHPFIKHLERILSGNGLTKEQFGLTQERIDYFLVPNQIKEAKRNWEVASEWGKNGHNGLEQFRKSDRHLRAISKSFSDIHISEEDILEFLQTQCPYLAQETITVIENMVGYVDIEVMQESISHLNFLLNQSGKTLEDVGFTQEKVRSILSTPRFSSDALPPREVLQIQARRNLVMNSILPVTTEIGDIGDEEIALFLTKREEFARPSGVNHSWKTTT